MSDVYLKELAEKLAACPTCGSAPRVVDEYYQPAIYCVECRRSLRVPFTTIGETLVTIWNAIVDIETSAHRPATRTERDLAQSLINAREIAVEVKTELARARSVAVDLKRQLAKKGEADACS